MKHKKFITPLLILLLGVCALTFQNCAGAPSSSSGNGGSYGGTAGLSQTYSCVTDTKTTNGMNVQVGVRSNGIKANSIVSSPAVPKASLFDGIHNFGLTTTVSQTNATDIEFTTTISKLTIDVSIAVAGQYKGQLELLENGAPHTYGVTCE